jgi:hypothetical protein
MAPGEARRVTAIPLERRLPGASSNLPGRPDPDIDPGTQPPLPRRWFRAVPIRFCSRWGLPCRLRCRKRGALLPHRFTLTASTLPRRAGAAAVCFLWHFPWGRPRRTLSGTACPWSPDFPPRTLPTPARAGRKEGPGRPSGRLTIESNGVRRGLRQVPRDRRHPARIPLSDLSCLANLGFERARRPRSQRVESSHGSRRS